MYILYVRTYIPCPVGRGSHPDNPVCVLKDQNRQILLVQCSQLGWLGFLQSTGFWRGRM